jgi:alkanesulfonate monooxygenase SsuD/methylene tetrahydromethanopterin reductase-like flavin-dependent oxidoreductase (luciferase family)
LDGLKTNVLRVGVYLPSLESPGDRGKVGHLAELAEGLGFADLWIPDHVIFPMPLVDAIVAGSIAAARTSTLTVCFGVLQVGLRHPVALARSIASLASEADGRVLLGLGMGGDFQPEWEALNIPVTERRARFDESLAHIVEMVNGRSCKHEGRHYSFEVDRLVPVPDSRVPVWLGARRADAIRRASKLDGWLSLYRTPAQFAEDLDQILRIREADYPFEAGVSLYGATSGSGEDALDRAAAGLRQAYNVPRAVAHRWVYGGLDDLRKTAEAYRTAGAHRVAVMTSEPPDEAWPRVAEVLGTM